MTAVEWFAMITEAFGCVSKIQLEEAKRMEKEQIKDAFDDGVEEGVMRSQSEEYNIEYYVSPERYYNETFKSE